MCGGLIGEEILIIYCRCLSNNLMYLIYMAHLMFIAYTKACLLYINPCTVVDTTPALKHAYAGLIIRDSPIGHVYTASKWPFHSVSGFISPQST